jgi:hypothetical protein
MAGINPIENASAEDAVMFAGERSPGICKLSGFARKFTWDVKAGKGVKGSTTTLTSYPPAEGTITFYLWEPEHFDEWESFQKKFDYDTTKKSVNALDVYHPTLSSIGVKSLVCKSIGARVPEGKGLFSVALEFLEYNPPPKKDASKSPDGSKGTADCGPGAIPDPIGDAQQKEIAGLLATARGDARPDAEHIPQRRPNCGR